jgi:ABC-2 type transport system permease protein
MFIIFRKEIASYLTTPFGYIFLGIFLLLSGIVFSTYNLLGGAGDMNGMFGLLSNLSFMIFPILTIKMFADEKSNGMEPLLLTSRLTSAQIVLGKFFAACFVYLIALGSTFVYVLILMIYGFPYMPSIVGSYIGFYLLGITFISVCTFMSSLSETYMTAAVASFGALVSLMLAGAISRTIQIPVLSQLFSSLAVASRYDEFVRGILRPGPIIYFISVSSIFVCLTIFSFERRRFT